jgi:hypothetical protein
MTEKEKSGTEPTSPSPDSGEANLKSPSPVSGEGGKTEPPQRPKEIGGPSGPEPTRYGDWERNGRVSDF